MIYHDLQVFMFDQSQNGGTINIYGGYVFNEAVLVELEFPVYITGNQPVDKLNPELVL